MLAPLLRDNLQPTDFANADCRVSPWRPFDGYGVTAVRVWTCSCGPFWFHRHEWQRAGQNATDVDGWIFYGYYPRHKHSDRDEPADARAYDAERNTCA